MAIGELFDVAIVDVENVYRQLRENKLLEKPKNTLRVIFEASSEVLSSIVIATLIVCLVFIPLFSMGGIERRLFVPRGQANRVKSVGNEAVYKLPPKSFKDKKQVENTVADHSQYK